jgi:hypothetical protein
MLKRGRSTSENPQVGEFNRLRFWINNGTFVRLIFFVDLLRRYGNASPMDEHAFSDERVMLIGKQTAFDHNIRRYQLATGLWLK